MEIVWTILITVGVLIPFYLIYYLVMRYLHARNLARYDNYDRALSEQDQKYIEQAVMDLEMAANVKTPKWYKVLLYTGFLPAMFLSWAVLGGCFWGLDQLLDLNISRPTDLIYRDGGDFEWTYLGVVFGGMFLAAAALYAFSILISPFSNYVALNSDMSGFDKDKVRAGLLAKLEHKIRCRELHTSSKFNADKFLSGVNKSYRDGCLKWFYGCMGISLIFAFFDLRSETSFYPEQVVTSGAYFSVAPKQTVAYTDVTSVTLECYFSDNKPYGNYYIFAGENKITEVHLGRDNIKEMAEVDEIFRAKPDIVFKVHQNKKGRNRLSATCIASLSAKLGRPQLVRRILSLDEE